MVYFRKMKSKFWSFKFNLTENLMVRGEKKAVGKK